MSDLANDFLTYSGSNFLRQRLVLSILSGRPVKINEIRSLDDQPGLREYEICLLKILEQMTNGTKIEISQTGTELIFVPGMLAGGSLESECDSERGISYYLEPLIYLAPFCKNKIDARLYGITNNQTDPSSDSLRATWTPVMRQFLLDDEGLEIKVTKRGFLPSGGGEVAFSCPISRTSLRPIKLEKEGKIKKIRGVAFTCKVSPTIGQRIIENAKKILTPFISDVFITADHRKGANAGSSPGFGLVLTAESTEGSILTSECISNPRGQEPSTPEDVGEKAARSMLDKIYMGGCVDSSAQSLSLLFMSLGQKDVSSLVTGPLSTYSIYMLRHLRDFFDVTFKIENLKTDEEEETKGSKNKCKLICVGVGYSNINKVML